MIFLYTFSDFYGILVEELMGRVSRNILLVFLCRYQRAISLRLKILILWCRQRKIDVLSMGITYYDAHREYISMPTVA